MFKSKRVFFSIGIILASLILLVSGCFNSPSKDLIVAIYSDDDYPPMEFKDSSGKFIGFDIDVIKAVGKKMGKKVSLVPAKWDLMFDELNNGKYDCIISSITITQERLAKMSFSKPYLYNSQVLAINSDDNSISSFMDLKGKKVICQEGTTGDTILNNLLNTVEFTIVKTQDTATMFSDLRAKKVDGVVADEVALRYRIKNEKDSFKVLSDKLAEENIGICFKKNKTTLKEETDKALAKLKTEGTLQNISQKWFGDNLIP